MKHTTMTKEKPVTEMVMKMERISFRVSPAPSPTLLKQQPTL